MDEDYLEDRATTSNLITSAAIGCGVALLMLIVLQILLITIALGTADYATGQPGPAGGFGYAVLSSLAGGVAAAGGAWAGARTARIRGAAQRPARLFAASAVGGLATLVLLLNLLTGGRAVAVAMALACVVSGALLGARAGAAGMSVPGRR